MRYLVQHRTSLSATRLFALEETAHQREVIDFVLISAMRVMAIPGRLELPTYGLGNRRSIRLSYGTENPQNGGHRRNSYQNAAKIASHVRASRRSGRDI